MAKKQIAESNSIPSHIAIIMDGNRRWAKKKLLPAYVGHEFGRRKLEPIIRHAAKKGIKFLTFWAFSTENWKRSGEEKKVLFGIIRKWGEKIIPRLQENGVQFKVIGEVERFPEDIQQILKNIIKKTSHNSRVIVNLGLSYGGRSEIIRTVKKIMAQHLKPGQVTEENFDRFLDTAGEPDPELMIRTGGVFRTSGFLPWQSAYSELYFTNTLWPDFSTREFDRAISWYRQQQRRFGK